MGFMIKRITKMIKKNNWCKSYGY